MIYLLRHGLDDENYIGGWSDVDLTPEGKKQIKNVREYIIKNGLLINKIFCSDIKRAISSCNIINEKLNFKTIYSKELRELNKGDLTGLSVNEAKEKFSEYVNEISIDTKYPNGESMRDFYSRICLDLDLILSEDNSLLITHRGVINMIYFILNNIELNMEKSQFDVSHGSLHEYNPKTKTIKRIF